jgi:glycosyltransferase involved in cell wall biosynthesis
MLNFMSIIVCTHNRCHNLDAVLHSLLKQEGLSHLEHEIIVVDNNSTDQTKEIVEKQSKISNGKIKYIFESARGLSNARNRGICEAKGDIIAFTDDDCLPSLHWLSEIHREFIQNEDAMGILGNACWEDGRPMYREKDLLRGNGLNMSFRRKLFNDIGLFDVYLGAGAFGHSADDVEFIYRASRHGKKIVICDHITIVHKHRINKEEELRILYRDSIGHTVFLLKYVLRAADVDSLKKICWGLEYNLKNYFEARKANNIERAQEKKIRLKGSIVGLLKGLQVWLILLPLHHLIQNKNRTSTL